MYRHKTLQCHKVSQLKDKTVQCVQPTRGVKLHERLDGQNIGESMPISWFQMKEMSTA